MPPYEICKPAFQVPKGMLQTRHLIKEDPVIHYSFKSPRECYKQEYWEVVKDFGDEFQVPKGMLQTKMKAYKKKLVKKSFKSPRECYKLA